MKKYSILSSLALVMLFASSVRAADVPQAFTLDGQLFSDVAGTTPLVDASIAMKIQILDEAMVCVVYEESQTVNTIFTKGYFTVQVGSATTDVKRSGLDTANAMNTIFQNTNNLTGKKLSDSTACTVTAAGGQRRYVRVTITPATLGGAPRILTPDIALDSVPSAVVAERAESLQGLRAADVLKVNSTAGSALTQANLESIFTSTTRFSALSAVIDGTSTNYMRTSSGAAAVIPTYTTASPPASAAVGSFWYDSTDGKLKYKTGSGTEVLSTSTGAVGTAGGDLSGTYPNPTVAKIQGVAVSATAPTTGQVLKMGATTWAASNFSIGDLKTSTGTQQFAGSTACTAAQTLTWSSLTDTFACTTIAGLDGGVITTGTVAAARLPAAASAWTISGTDVYRSGGSVTVGSATNDMNLTLASDGGILGVGTAGSGKTLTAAGAGTRFIWYPRNAAIRAGRVTGTQWDDANVGAFSAAFGNDVLASGVYSFAAGSTATASANNSISMGATTTASGVNSVAIGSSSTASAQGSTAIGSSATANGYNSTAFSGATVASTSNYGFAVGSSASVGGNDSVAMGKNATTAAGMGASFAIGQAATSSGLNSYVFGASSTASGQGSMVVGYNSAATGNYAMAHGAGVTAESYLQTTIGTYNTAVIPGSIGAWVATDPILVVGNGDSTSTRSTAMTVLKNGNTGIGVVAPTQKLDVSGNIKSSGQIVTGSFASTTNAINWDSGNSGTTTYDCASQIAFTNLRDGGTYTLVVTGTGTTMCDFSTSVAITGASADTVSYRFRPANAARYGSSHTLYTFTRVGTVVYASWSSGF